MRRAAGSGHEDEHGPGEKGGDDAGGTDSGPARCARRRGLGRAAMTRWLDELVAVLAPAACVSCRAPVGAGERLSPSSPRALPWLRRACPRCALPSHRGRPCPASGAAFLRAWAPMAYEGVARDLVAALKFRAALPVANLMAAHMAANLPAELRGPEIAGGAGGASIRVPGGDARGRGTPAAGVAVPGVAVPGVA